MKEFFCPFQGDTAAEYNSTTTVYDNGEVVTVADHDVSHLFQQWPKYTRLRGYATISDQGTVEFVPYSCRRIPRYTTLFWSPNAHIRETREFIICTIRLPKSWGFRKMLVEHYHLVIGLHAVLKKLLK